MSSSTVGVGADDLVTGEAVALELPAAGVAVRAVSGAVDVLATLVLLWAANVVAVLATADSDDALLSTAMLLATVLALVVLPTTLETLTRGRSLGKLALGPAHGARRRGPDRLPARLHPRARRAWSRSGCCSRSPRSSARWSARGASASATIAAGTYVVRERVSMTIPPPPTMPPALAGWAVQRRHRPAARRPGDGGAAVPRPGSGPQPRLPRRGRRRAAGGGAAPRRAAAAGRQPPRVGAGGGRRRPAPPRQPSGCSARPPCGPGCCRRDPLAAAWGRPGAGAGPAAP